MYKKALAILLSVLLLVTSFVTALSLSAFAVGSNMLADGKFESGFSGWEVFNNGGSADKNFTVIEDNGDHVLSVGPGYSMFKQVELKAGVSYTVGFNFKFDGNAQVPDNFSSFYRSGFAKSIGALGNSNFNSIFTSGHNYYSIYDRQKDNSTEWKFHSYSFTPSADMSTYFVIGSYNHQGLANVFIDDVFLCETEDVVEVKLSAGTGGTVPNSYKTFKDDEVTVIATPSVGYEFKCWSDGDGNTISNNAKYVFTAAADTELTASFSSASYNMIPNGDFAVNSLDGFEVYKNGDNSAAELTFAANGTDDYILQAKAGHSIYKQVELKGGVSYTMSFDIKFASADVPATYTSFYRAGFVGSVGALSGSSFVVPVISNGYYPFYDLQKTNPTSWKTHSVTFTPDEDITAYAVVGSYNHQCVVDFEVDNWMLYKTTDRVTANAVANGGGSVSPETAVGFLGEEVTFVATPDDGYAFEGWFDGETLVSSDAEYTFALASNVTLTASFKSTAPVDNYIINGDFEKPFTTDKISDTTVTAVTGKWGKIYSGVARMEAVESGSFTSADSSDKNGTRYILSGATKDSNQYIRAFGQYVELQAGDYVLEYDARATVSDMFVMSFKKGQQSINYGSDLIKYITKSDSWEHYTVSLNVKEAGLYQVAFGGNIQGKGAGDFAIDNVKLAAYVEYNPNHIVNGDFEEPFTTDKISDTTVTAVTGKWGKIYSGVARMEAVESGSFTSADSSDKNGTRYILSGATKDSNQYVRAFGQYVELEAGDYVLEYDARATVSDMFVMSFGKGQHSIQYGTDTIKYILKSDSWKHYIVNLNVKEAGLYQVAFGGNIQGKGAGDFAIDNVKLVSAADCVVVSVTTDGGGSVIGPEGSLVKGETATVVATPEDGFTFAGWFNGSQIVADTATYTFEVNESVTLKAVFEADLSGETGIVKNGDFDVSTAGWKVVKTANASSYSVVTDPETNSKVLKTDGRGGIAIMQKISLKANVEYVFAFDFKFHNYDAVPATYNTFYRSGILNDPDGNLGNANFVGPKDTGDKYVSIYHNINPDKTNDWNSITYNYTPKTDADVWFVIGAFNNQGESDFSVDNVNVVPANEVLTFKADGVSWGGSGKVKASKDGVVLPGTKINLTATPNAGSTFGGWYCNGQLISSEAVYTHEVKGTEFVYARFYGENGKPANQLLDNFDFATKDLTGWGENNINGKDTIEYVTVDDESFAIIRENDMLYQTIEMEPYTTYNIRIDLRIPDVRENRYLHSLEFFRFGFASHGHPNVLQSGALAKDPYSYNNSFATGTNNDVNNKWGNVLTWNTHHYSFSNNTSETVIAHVVIGAPYCKSDVHVRRFECIKYDTGIFDYSPSKIYGEDLFNLVNNPSFEDETTDDDWGKDLPKGWSVEKQGDSKYLSVVGDQSKTYSFKVKTGINYLVAFDLRADKKGTSSVVIADSDGNPYGDALAISDKKAVFYPTADGRWQRFAVELLFAGNESGYDYVNITINAGSNAMDIDNVCIVPVGYAVHETNINKYNVTATDYDSLKVYSPTSYYSYEDGTLLEGEVIPDDGIISTGDDSYQIFIIVAVIILACATVMVLLFRRPKNSKKEEESNE